MTAWLLAVSVEGQHSLTKAHGPHTSEPAMADEQHTGCTQVVQRNAAALTNTHIEYPVTSSLAGGLVG